MNIGNRIKIKSNVKFYKNRTGKIVDCIDYNDRKKYKVILVNFNDIPLWFFENELVGLCNDWTHKNH